MRYLSLYTICLIFLLTNSSCNTIDDGIYEMVGIYVGNVVGEAGPFEMSISADGSDNITIEAPFDGEFWNLVKADVDNVDEAVKDIEIKKQNLPGNIEIWGNGFYNNTTLQLDYQMKFDNEIVNFRIVATK